MNEFKGHPEYQYQVTTFTPLEQMRIQKYDMGLVKYGYLPLLRIMSGWEAIEEYRECFLIWYVLDKYNRVMGTDIPTKLTEQAEEDYRASFWKFGLSGEMAMSNINAYTIEIMTSVIHLHE